jgi:hypothetical protein
MMIEPPLHESCCPDSDFTWHSSSIDHREGCAAFRGPAYPSHVVHIFNDMRRSENAEPSC